MPIIDFLAPFFAFTSDPTAWVALFTLIVLEIVLGIDNLIFISILTNKLPEAQRTRARRIGISLALVLRLVRTCARRRRQCGVRGDACFRLPRG
jgi:predicted tellurium resistance membrane protein TerC